MTILFYYKPSLATAIHLGTGKPSVPDKKLVAYTGPVILSAKGVFIGGTQIKECVLFHGEPPTLMRCDFDLDKIRWNARLKRSLPLTYIDQRGNVIEGATGKVIFKA